MDKPTNGTWKAVENEDGWAVINLEPGPGVVYIAQEINQGRDNGKADAHVLAAAKDLLQACNDFVRKVEAGTAKSSKSYLQMKAAIAKAENG